MNLTDAFTVDGVRRTADGYLAAFARVARTGIQEYRGSELGRPDLDRVRVYRPPEEVFSSDAMKSFAHRPVTLRHPTQPVTSNNWRKHAGGQTGDEVVRDGEYIRVPMVMMDQKLIDAYEQDGVRELSMGYSTDIKWRTGVTDAGEEYDAVQTAIRGNHLAVVPTARGGDQLRISDETIDDGLEWLDDDKDRLGHGSYPRGRGPGGGGGGNDKKQILEQHNELQRQVVDLRADLFRVNQKIGSGDGNKRAHEREADRLGAEIHKKLTAAAALYKKITAKDSDQDLEDDKDELGHGSNKRGEGGGDKEEYDTKTGPSLRQQVKNALEMYGAGSAKYRTLKAKLAKVGDSVEDGMEFEDNIKDGDITMTKLVLDGLTVTVADDQSGAIIEKHIATLVKQLADAKAEGSAAEEKAESAATEAAEKKKMIDAKDGEIAVLKKQVEDAKITPQALDALVKVRAAVIDKAKTLVDAKYVFDGKTIEQIRKDAVLSKLGDAAKDMNDGALEGAFAALTVSAKAADSAAELGDAALRRPHSGGYAVDARDAALEARDKAMSEAWKTPSAAA